MDDNVVGERVRQRRIELGITQEELAKRMGYKTRSAINNIEAGRRVSQKIVEKLASQLYVSPSYLMGWDDNPTQQDFDGLDPNDTDIKSLPKFDKPTKLDAQTAAFANDVARYHSLIDLLKECNWHVNKIKKGSILNGIETDQTFYGISNNNGVIVYLTYDEFVMLQDHIYDSIDNEILSIVKEKLGMK